MRTEKQARLFGDVLSFGWVLPASIAAGAGLGWLGDRLLGIFPVLTLVLGGLGCAAGLWQVYREAAALSGEKDDQETGPRKDSGSRGNLG